MERFINLCVDFYLGDSMEVWKMWDLMEAWVKNFVEIDRVLEGLIKLWKGE